MGVPHLTCQLDPDTNSTLHLYLFKHVRNAVELRKSIMDGRLKCSIIKPSLVVDPFQIIIAANKAVVSEKYKCMKTRSVFAEVIFNLSLSKNIIQSLMKFGIGDKDKSMIVAFIVNDQYTDENMRDILKQIDGVMRPIDELKNLSDTNQLKKIYKLSYFESKSDVAVLDSIVNKIVTKNFIGY